MHWRPLLAAAVAASTSGAVPPSQVTTVDEATFTLYVQGDRVGHEQYTISRVPQAGGFAMRANATLTIGSHQIESALVTDTAGVPVTYRRAVRDTGRVVSQVVADVTGPRVTARQASATGRAERAWPIEPGTVMLDDDTVHQFYFVARRADGRVPAISPQKMSKEVVTVSRRGAASVDIGTGSHASQHLTVTSETGVTTDVWIDNAGRLLRVAVPSRGFVAVRDEPPR